MHTRERGSYEFGPFRLDVVERMLLGEGQLVALSPKAFDLLFVLVRKAGRVVDKEELMREVWPDTFVEENNLTVNISALRKALGNGSSDKRYIQTVPRRGYRFVASVRQTAESAPLAQGRTEALETDSDILVGREPELRILETFLRHAAEGAGRMIFITGGPGIGKTALSNAFLRRAQSTFPVATLCRGRCLEQYGAGEAYLPVLDSLSDLLGRSGGKFVAEVLRSCAPTWCLQFPAFFGSNDGLERLSRETVGATKERMLREMADALGALASSAPVVLHFEDLHWADPSSIDLLRRLCQDAGKQRVLVTGTFRPEDVERGNRPFQNFLLETQTHNQCEEIALGLLRQEHLATYLDTRFAPNRFEPELAALIHRKTEGQPLFATSLVQFLVERGDIARVGDHWMLTRLLSELDLEAPVNVRKMIRKKIEALDAEDRRAIEYASIQGEEFTSAVLAGLLEMDDLDLEERLDRLDKTHRLIQTLGEEELPDGTFTTRYRFAHVLYQNDLYQSLVSKRRALLHRQTGDLMIGHYGDQAARFATQLAMHFERGRDFARAVEFLIRAGDNAGKLFVYTQACEHFSHALELAERLPAENRPSHRMSLYKKRGDAGVLRGRPAEAEEDYNALLAIARSAGHAEWECRTLIDLANVHIYTRKPEEMAAYASRALELAERIGRSDLWCEAKGQLAASCQVVGRVAEAHRLYDESIPVAQSLRHIPALLQGLTYRGVAHFFRTEYDRAVLAETEAIELASESQNSFYLALSRTYLGFILANQGRISEALSSLSEAIALGRRSENRVVLARAPNGIGWIHREMGDLRMAIQYDEACVETSRSSGATEAEANARVNLVYDYTLAGEPAKAMAAMQRVDSLFDCELWNRWRFYDVRQQAAGAEYWLAGGNLERAEEHARRLLANAQRYGVPKYVAVAHRILGEIGAACGDLDSAEEALTHSIEPFVNNPAPLAEWRSHAALGRLLLRFGNRPAAAREAFGRAAGVIQRIAAGIAEPELRSAFLDVEDIRQVFSESA
jgi:DNA-binding winged helix-turn-helix (wHTH) protein/tetratricopeptide (TPR) repeat protein